MAEVAVFSSFGVLGCVITGVLGGLAGCFILLEVDGWVLGTAACKLVAGEVADACGVVVAADGFSDPTVGSATLVGEAVGTGVAAGKAVSLTGAGAWDLIAADLLELLRLVRDALEGWSRTRPKQKARLITRGGPSNILRELPNGWELFIT